MVLSQREGLTRDDGLRLVGVKPVDPAKATAGGLAFPEDRVPRPMAANDDGWLTSMVYSPHLGRDIALGYLKDGDRPDRASGCGS